MKRLFVICSAITLLLSCEKHQYNIDSQNVEPQPVKDGSRIEFNFSVNYSDTKAVKQDFFAGDKIYAFFQGIDGRNHVVLTKQDDGSWNAEPRGNLKASDLTPGNTIYAVYFPLPDIETGPDGDGGVIFRDPDNKQPVYTYYMTGSDTYTLNTNDDVTSISASLNMAIPDNYVQFFIDRNGDDYCTDYKYRLAVQNIRPVACRRFVGNGFEEKTIDYGQPMWGYHYCVTGKDSKSDGEGLLFSGKIDPASWTSVTDHRMVFFDTSAAAVSKVFSGKTLSSHDAVKLNMTSGWKQALTPPSTVDLGTATCTWGRYFLGAESAGNLGFLFVWGEISPFSDDKAGIYDGGSWCMRTDDYYIDDNYWNAGWNNTSYTKYHNGSTSFVYMAPGYVARDVMDNRSQLEGIDDAATAWLGPEWRMPTSNELETLIPFINYGWQVTDPYNCKLLANELLLPAAGSGYTRGADGYLGKIWSSSYLPDPANEFNVSSARCLEYRNDDYVTIDYSAYRNGILSILPVKNK